MRGSHVRCTRKDSSHIHLRRERSILSTLHTFRLPLSPSKRGMSHASVYDFSVEKKNDEKMSCHNLWVLTFIHPVFAGKLLSVVASSVCQVFWPCRRNARHQNVMKAPHQATAQSVSFPAGKKRLGTTRRVLLQGGASPRRTVSLYPVDLGSLLSSFRWPTPSCGGTTANATGACSPVSRLDASNIGS